MKWTLARARFTLQTHSLSYGLGPGQSLVQMGEVDSQGVWSEG